MTRAAACVAVLSAAIVVGATPRVAGDESGRAGQAAAPPQLPQAPKLLVIVVVDQMRFDYLDRLPWSGGLKRLAAEGAVFEQAFYPYLNTVTCAGHATIGTGAFPATHGIILNEWYRRATGKLTSCTDDPAVSSVPYADPPEPIGHSARALRAETLGDRLRAASPRSRVVTVSMKPRSAVMLAGHGSTATTWFGDTNVWASSSAFTTAPLPEVRAFVDANPVERYRSEVWDRVADPGAYSGPDESPHERPRAGWTSTFPHPLAGAPGTRPDRFFTLWERSPFSDEYLGRMAAHLVQAFQLGQRDVVDYLGVSFSGLDYVGHDFGPESHEVQDTLMRLDATLGRFFAALDAAVGRDRYVVGLSADHGVSRIPEAVRAAGEDAGRVLNQQVLKVAEAAMQAAHGPGPHVAHVEYSNIYLTEAAQARAARDPSFVDPLIKAVAAIPGVARVFPSAALPERRTSEDAIERAAALSHHPDESGDLTLVLKQNWVGTNSSAATHGSAQSYDQHVPVVFLGAPFVPGRYRTPASPADVAPTLASLVHLQMPQANGRALTEAVRLKN